MESVMWQQIEDMNFNARGHEGAGKYLVEESGLTLKGMKEVESFARNKCDALYNKLFDVKGVSDDSYDDLRWQIVANGEKFYNSITLREAQKMIDENRYTESFAYAFHIVSELEEEEWHNEKRNKQEQYLEQIRQGYGGGFITKLVAAWDHADNDNKMKLAIGFPELFGFLA